MGRRAPRLDRVPTIREYEDTVARMKAEAFRRPVLEKVLPLTIMVTGARVSEALMLTVLDVDEDDLVVYVPTLKRRDRVKRAVPVPSWYVSVLRLYVVRNAVTDKLFPVSRQTAWLIVRRETGYPPHAWRHAFAMYLLFKGVDPETVRRILGHSTWEMVEYYVRAVRVDMRARTPLEEL